MSILLEGADNSGKTTLGKELLQLNPHLQYFLAGSAPSSPQHEVLCIQQQHALAAMPGMVIDRATCISQQVYQEDRLCEVALMNHVDLLIQVGTIIVYCRPSTDKLMSFEKFTWRDEESESHKQKILANQHNYIERYDKIMTIVPHIFYDYEDEMSSAWLRKMLSEAPADKMVYFKLRDVMMRSTLHAAQRR